MKLYKGICILSKGYWNIGVSFDVDKVWDGGICVDVNLLKIKIWFRIGIEKWGGVMNE